MTQELGTNYTPTPPERDIPTASFVLSLIAGILILTGLGMMTAFTRGTPYFGMMGGHYGTMNGYAGMMQGFGYGGWSYGVLAIGLVSGVAVLVGALMIYSRPNRAFAWGMVIVIFSALSLLSMGGFFFGAILGIIGGALALAWHPREARAASVPGGGT